MQVGAPRTVSPPPEDLIALGQEMLEWVETNNPPHLSCWWSKEKFFAEKTWDTICRRPEFIPYYDASLRIIGLNYILKESQIEPNVKNRFLRFYFKDLKGDENETKTFEATLKAQADKEANSAFVAQHAAMMDYLQQMRGTSAEKNESHHSTSEAP